MRSGSRGSCSAAVPTPTSDAPATRYCRASAALATPPIPMSGTGTACRTRQVARTPTGRSPAPLTPPLPNPSAGRRRRTSTTSPGRVLTRVSPSAPASTAARAVSAIAGSVGESFTNRARRVAARARVTTSRRAAGSAPNSSPPAFTFGQLTFSS